MKHKSFKAQINNLQIEFHFKRACLDSDVFYKFCRNDRKLFQHDASDTDAGMLISSLFPMSAGVYGEP